MTFTSPKTGEPVQRAWQIPTNARRPARAAAVLRDLGGSDLRADGTFARPRGGLLCRLCRRAGGFRNRRTEIRRQRGLVLRERARPAPLHQLRDRPAADRPQQARAQAERPDAPCRRGEGARRRHRDLGRPAGRDRRRLLRLRPAEQHSSPGARRRELRQLRRDPDLRAGREAVFAAAVRDRAPTTPSTIRCRAGSTSPTATSCSTTCSCPGSTSSSIATSSSPAINGSRRRRISTATTRRRCAT